MTTQFQDIVNTLNSNFQNTEFKITDSDNEITIMWDNLPTEYDVFTKIMPLTNIFNFGSDLEVGALEREKYTKKVTILNKVSKDDTERLFHVLLSKLRSDDRFSIKLINHKVSERNPDMMEIFSIKTKTIQLRHLIDNDFSNYNVRISSVDIALNNALTSLEEDTNPEIIQFLREQTEHADFKESLEKVRNFYSNMYFTNGLQEFILELLKRKIKDCSHLFVEDFLLINKEVLQHQIKLNGHKGLIEEVLANISMEQLSEPLFGIPSDSGNYKELLTKHLVLELHGSELSPIEQEIYANTLSDMKQTVNNLSGFQGFTKKSFNGNEYLEKELTNNRTLVFTDNLIILKVGNEIATKLTDSIQEKISILTSI